MPGGRPLKNGVDYFPLEVILDDKFELIEAEHGITGFGILIKIYQKIYANNYWIKWDKKAVLVFSNRVNVDINSINAIINSCIEWEVFNKKLFKNFEILTSKGIQERFFEIVKRRKAVEVCGDFLLIVNAYKNLINVDHNSQRKGKERKGKGNNKETSSLLQKYLQEKIIENNFIENKDKIFEFYNYRQSMPAAKRYKSEKGINGLFRNLNECRKSGLIIFDCIEIAMEKNWLSFEASYFKNNKSSNYQTRSDKNKQACHDFVYGDENEK